MKILNLYAGLGGNRVSWKGEITAVENTFKIAKVYKDNFPNDIIIISDAHEFLAQVQDGEFDFIWSSPPCQTHSKMNKATRHKLRRYRDLSLYEEIIFLRENFKKTKWVVENVVPFYKPYEAPTAQVGRHLFWSNFYIDESFDLPNHPNFIQAESPEAVQSMKEWLGIKYEGNIYYGTNHSPAQVLRNCVHPKLGLHIFNCYQTALI